MKGKHVLTLYYHRINVLQNDFNLLCVSPIRFRQQMLYLKQNYQIVRFEDDWKLLDSDAVCITFDDGYFDNCEYAMPILEELEIPATIFVSTGTMDQSRELWWDELAGLLLEGNNIPLEFHLTDDEFACSWDTSTWEYRKNCYRALHYLIKNYITVQKREDWMEQLWEWRGMQRTGRKDNLTVSGDECKNLAESKMISIGAHTVSHPSLACLDREDQEQEIRRSLEELSELLDTKITIFSYPFGVPEIDFNEDTIQLCRECGIVKAASTENALWNPATDSFKIPRKIVRDWDLMEFDRKIKNYWEE